MRRLARVVLAAGVAALVASCGSPQPEPVPITPPSEAARAPSTAAPSLGTIAPPGRLDPKSFPAGAIYVCSKGASLTAIAFDEKVGKLCRTHPEMGPCQYERNLCRGGGGRVYAGDGSEITMAHEAEYDKKVMRVRFKAN